MDQKNRAFSDRDLLMHSQQDQRFMLVTVARTARGPAVNRRVEGWGKSVFPHPSRLHHRLNISPEVGAPNLKFDSS